MSLNRFMIELEEDIRCPLSVEREYRYVCKHHTAMDPVTFKDECIGNLEKNRPAWCPLEKMGELKE